MRGKWPLRARVEVEWRDSCSRGGWDSAEEHKKKSEVGPIRSIGYLLTLDKDVVQLAQTQSSMNGHVNDTITIPREAVRRIKRIGGFR